MEPDRQEIHLICKINIILLYDRGRSSSTQENFYDKWLFRKYKNRGTDCSAGSLMYLYSQGCLVDKCVLIKFHPRINSILLL